MKFKKLKVGDLFTFDGELFIKEKAKRNEKGHRIGIAWSVYPKDATKPKGIQVKRKEWSFIGDEDVKKQINTFPSIEEYSEK